MSDEDEPERKSGELSRSTPGDRRDPSLATALEASLQAGLRSLSEGLGNLVGEDARRTSSRRGVGTRPSAGRERTSLSRRADESEPERIEPSRGSTVESAECLVDTRLADGEFVVTADLLGASKDDVSAGINPRTNELVISKADTTVGRVDLPWSSPETKNAWFNNGILEVRVRSADAEPSS